ncbi:MAG TPA: hypothetical protein VFI68_11385, partial [Anaerolineales bacterium]|nr:hypothetical protein [Anaerolineales bacterium]
MSDPILDQGEIMIRKEGGMEYVNAGRYSAWLYLTSQRIIVKRMLGNVAAYPLSHLTKADIAEHQPSPFSLMNFKLLCLTFDNGGAILFGISGDKSAWIQSVDRARANAPELAYTTMPTEFSKSASSPKFLWVAGAIIGLCSFATCTLALAA